MYDNNYMPIDGIEWDSEKARINYIKYGVSFENQIDNKGWAKAE